MNDKTEPLKTKRFSILAVDDERANLNLLRRTFRNEYNLFMAEDGIEGLELLKEHPVDMIITDQRMPRMTGVKLLARSREIVPDAVRVILTAYADVKDIIDAVNQGQIYRYVLKPWSPDELKITVANALNHYALQQENKELISRLQKSLLELRAAQQELLIRERLSTLGRMAGSVIHDLKQPMSNIRSGAALLAKSNLTPTMREEFSGIIMCEVDRLVGMTREILDFTKGEIRLKLEEFTFETLLDEIEQTIKPDCDNAGIEVCRLSQPIGAIRADRERLRRVLLNLMANAREAVPSGGRIQIFAEHHSDHIALSVMDNGVGIPVEILDRLFEPFVSHGKHDGTGLGLAISKSIIEAHRGKISARNLPEGGAAFDITLPLTTNG